GLQGSRATNDPIHRGGVALETVQLALQGSRPGVAMQSIRALRRCLMLARIFIDRPVLAWVISIVIVLLGPLAQALLPGARYPQVPPPTVRVTAIYPGANARVVADTIAAPIEQQVNGVE